MTYLVTFNNAATNGRRTERQRNTSITEVEDYARGNCTEYIWAEVYTEEGDPVITIMDTLSDAVLLAMIGHRRKENDA